MNASATGHGLVVAADFAVCFSLRQGELPGEARAGVLRELGHIHATALAAEDGLVRIRCEVRAHDGDEAGAYVAHRVAAVLRAWYGLEPRIVDVVVDERVPA